ncbi:eCIS core domain-containing protein [Streptomyces syringium]|uniref:eCIS core domain-containing protein n=1 Tax=Streptomyces syringium TaxID=76729 RepID=A0ABS4YE56_9ACTN|nr:hypothetical protein [Streptomyces syringium]
MRRWVPKSNRSQRPARISPEPAQAEPARAVAPPERASLLLALQRAAGNGAVLRMLRAGGASRELSAVPEVVRGGGRPLDAGTRGAMEARLGADLSDVRVHTGPAAQRSAMAIGARAYTAGNHVVIGRGGADKATLAHELTHVVQQRRGPVAGTDTGHGFAVSDPDDRFEREAEANASRAMRAPVEATEQRPLDTVPAPAASTPVVQRAMHLANYDERIYQDSLDPGAEYAFVKKADGKLLFAEYGGVDRLKAALGAVGFAGDLRSSALDAFIKGAYRDRGPVWHHLWHELGGLFHYDSVTKATGPVGEEALGRATPGLVAAIVRHGPQIWHNSGGSRAPRAEGRLYGLAPSRDQALHVLGIDEATAPHFDDVRYESLAERQYEHRRALFQDKDNGANVFEYEGRFPGDRTRMMYVSTAGTARAAAHRIRIANRRFSDAEFFNRDMDEATQRALHAEYARLTAPRPDTGWVPGTDLTAVDRGAGQDSAMNGWNALGVVAYAKRFLGDPYELEQNWEWLHVQGAQIGGSTDATNLVAGAYVTNSAMIPYEDMIAKWAGTDARHFWARFEVTPAGTLFPARIRLSIKTDGHRDLGTLPGMVLAEFDPLHGRIIDRLAGEVMKRNVDATRGVYEPG